MKYRELLEWGRAYLEEHNIEEWDNDGWLLFEKVFSLNRASYFLMQGDEILDETLVDKYRSYIYRRGENEPLQYITGEQNFMGYDFCVTPDVLIPRFDTEVLVEKVFDYIRHCGSSSLRLLDMCTGSGCIAISLGLLAKEAGIKLDVVGVDISDKALNVARENAKRLEADNVSFVQSDLFGDMPADKFDIIVSNPPYIESEVIETLSPEVKNHEPRLALDGSADGLHFYRIIVDKASMFLNSGGKIYFEIGCEQGADVSELLTEAGFKDVMIIKDLTRLDRVVSAGKE